jgi:RimJ/RimL family protein N-acetyltransferase
VLPAELELRDGSTVEIRPIEPDDAEGLRQTFDRLSEESRYRRFLTPMPHLNTTLLLYLTDVDHHDHEALVAIDPASDEGVGVARFVRDDGDDRIAEAAVTVADDWQGRGLGTLLLEALAVRAREEEIERFTALMLAENETMRDVLEQLGPTRRVEEHEGAVEIDVELPADGVGPHLKALLTAAATNEDGPAAVRRR